MEHSPLPRYLLILRRLVTAPSESPEDRFPSAPPAQRALGASVSGFAEIRGYPVASSEPRPCGTPSAIRVAAGYSSIAPNPPCQLEDHTSEMSTARDSARECRSSSRSRKAACAARALRSAATSRGRLPSRSQITSSVSRRNITCAAGPAAPPPGERRARGYLFSANIYRVASTVVQHGR